MFTACAEDLIELFEFKPKDLHLSGRLMIELNVNILQEKPRLLGTNYSILLYKEVLKIIDGVNINSGIQVILF